MTTTIPTPDSIVDQSIAAEQEIGRQTVAEFVSGAEERAEELVEEFREEVGDDVRWIAGPVMATMKSYRASTLSIYDPHQEVANTASKGAAAWNEKGSSNAVVYDFSAMQRKKNKGYWRRVRRHEEVHQKKQAAHYNADTVTVTDEETGEEEEVDVVGTLTEWEAIRLAGQPNAELTEDYREHATTGDYVAKIVGKERVEAALASGDIIKLQEQIEEKADAERRPLQKVA